MRHLLPSVLLGLALSTPALAVFRDEVGDIDFHHALFGVPQPETTFYHRPRKEDKASLLYTLGDVGVFGAVNPSNGQVVWRHQIAQNVTNGGGHLRAPDEGNWVAAAYGNEVQAWDALTGRNVWHREFTGDVKDLEIMEVTANERKDVLALFDEHGATVLRRINALTGSVVWEFREANKDIPLQISSNNAHLYIISLHGSTSLKVATLDVVTGARVDDATIAKGEISALDNVMFVGANSAAPLVAWTNSDLSKLSVYVLGVKVREDILLPSDAVEIKLHAPHLAQSQAHFLVHIRTDGANRAEVYHTDIKTGHISKAYELPHVKGLGAFAVSSSGGNVYFTRQTDDESLVFDSTSSQILERWYLDKDSEKAVAAVAEVVKKPGGEGYAVRSAALTTVDDWVLVRNGAVDWIRHEGLSGAVAAAYAEVAESESLAKALEHEAETNPLSAYVSRVKRHIDDLKHLPAWLISIPERLSASIFGSGSIIKSMTLSRDLFGFNKVIVIATRRGRVYGLNSGNNGAVAWSTNVFPQSPGQNLDVKGIIAKEEGVVTIVGAKGESADIDVQSGEIIRIKHEGAPVSSTAVIDSAEGQWLLSLGPDGQPVESLNKIPEDTIVVRDGDKIIKGLKFVGDGASQDTWQIKLLPSQVLAAVATRPAHDPTASIGRVLGDRRVNYKYLNPNTIVLALMDAVASTLTIQVVDTVTGQVVASQAYEGADPTKEVSCAMSENWYACSFFGQYNLDDGTRRLVKGYQLVVLDLYESADPNDRGPLGDAANFSPLEPVDSPTSVPLPHAVSQAFIIPQPLTAMTVTQTRQGIANRFILAYMPEVHSIVGLPRQATDPRRPVGRDPTPAEMEAEGLMKYWPSMEIDPRSIITHEREVFGVRDIVASPALVESTSLVVAYGGDVFGTRVAPSGMFDILGKGFNKASLILTVVALFFGTLFLAPLVSNSSLFLLLLSSSLLLFSFFVLLIRLT